MSRKDDKKKDLEPGLGTVVAKGAAVLAGAAIVYGAKKLFDLWNTSQSSSEGASASAPPPKQSACAKSCEDSDSDNEYHHSDGRRRPPDRVTRGPDRSGYRSGGVAGAVGNVAYTSSVEGASAELYGARPKTRALETMVVKREVSSMSEQLDDYYQQYVKIDVSRMKVAASVAKEVERLLSSRLPMFMPDAVKKLSKTTELRGIGSAVDETQVINPDGFDFVVAFELNDKEWMAKTTDTPGKLRIARSESGSETSLCDANDCLLASKIGGCLNVALQGVVASVSDKNYTMTTSWKEKTSTIRLSVKYFAGGVDNTLVINVSPEVSIAGKRWVSRDAFALPSNSARTSDDDDRLWRASNFDAETAVLNCFGPAVTAHRQLLMIFKAIRLNFPQQFGVLTAYHYKTVLLHSIDDQSDASEWSPETLSERFIDFLVELGSCCKEGVMAEFSDQRVNLLANVDAEALKGLAAFVNRTLGQHDFTRLLEDRKFGRN